MPIETSVRTLTTPAAHLIQPSNTMEASHD